MQTKEDIPEFEKLEQQLHSFLSEISELSKKKPNDPLNKFKLKFVNSTLEGLNRILADYKPFPDFEKFDLDDLPSNSDVVLILSQYAAAAYRFRSENTEKNQYGSEWYWVVGGRVSTLETERPDHFRYHPR